MTTTIGKREFLHHASQYLKEVESKGGTIVISTRGVPSLQISSLKKKTVSNLKGLIKIKVDQDLINEPILPGFDQW
jgi:antitoxin (DNA-binding transcriptional repressor) of toxin-antitoxin stability system